MSVKTTLTLQEDFTGEFPAAWAGSGLWRFNESEPDSNDRLMDSSGHGRGFNIIHWSGTTANMLKGWRGYYFRLNLNNPTSEKTYLQAVNDGSIFSSLGERIVVGGWMNPTTYSVGNTFCPIFNTRQGPGQPILYLSLYQGRPRLMLYNSSGSLILDESVTPPFSLVNNGWYFLAAVIEPDAYKACYVVGDRSSGTVWISSELTIEGELNRSCTADLIMGMHADTYYYAGGFDEWFLDTDSDLTAEDLAEYFKATLFANGGDLSGDVDALTEAGSVTLRSSDGAYPASGQLITKAAACSLSGTGRVATTSEYTAGVTAIEQVETSTSDDLEEWSGWQAIGPSGELQSPNRQYIRFRVTLATEDASRTPKLLEIQLHDIPKAPYEKLGFARPVVLDANGAWGRFWKMPLTLLSPAKSTGLIPWNFTCPFTIRSGPYWIMKSRCRSSTIFTAYEPSRIRRTPMAGLLHRFTQRRPFTTCLSPRKKKRWILTRIPPRLPCATRWKAPAGRWER